MEKKQYEQNLLALSFKMYASFKWYDLSVFIVFLTY